MPDMITGVHIKGNYQLLHALFDLLMKEAGTCPTVFLLFHRLCSFLMAVEDIVVCRLCLFKDLQ